MIGPERKNYIIAGFRLPAAVGLGPRYDWIVNAWRVSVTASSNDALVSRVLAEQQARAC